MVTGSRLGRDGAGGRGFVSRLATASGRAADRYRGKDRDYTLHELHRPDANSKGSIALGIATVIYIYASAYSLNMPVSMNYSDTRSLYAQCRNMFGSPLSLAQPHIQLLLTFARQNTCCR